MKRAKNKIEEIENSLSSLKDKLENPGHHDPYFGDYDTNAPYNYFRYIVEDSIKLVEDMLNEYKTKKL